MSDLIVVVGGQYGSEAKGHVTAKIVKEHLPESPAAVVRVAGPNAGHTAYDSQGRRYAFRQIPVGVVVDRPGGTIGFIAAGSEIDLEVLHSELDLLAERDVPVRLMVDLEATIISEEDKSEESFASNRDLVAKIGSTGKGVGAARAGRIMREPSRRLADDKVAIQSLLDRGVRIGDVAGAIRADFGALPEGAIVVEGTQGFGLGLRAGNYPQTTSSDCRAIDFLAMLGIGPHEQWVKEFSIVVVARVYPIRVAGNSGPLRNETTWEALGLPEERTTVTNKVRRVGHEDWYLVADAVEANGGKPSVQVAVTMVDHKFSHLRDVDDPRILNEDPEFGEWLGSVGIMVDAPITMVTTGPNTHVWTAI